jgi:hypothetical protein
MVGSQSGVELGGPSKQVSWPQKASWTTDIAMPDGGERKEAVTGRHPRNAEYALNRLHDLISQTGAFALSRENS